MKRLLPLLFVFISGSLLADDAGFLVQLGLTDKESTVWDGSIKVTPGQVGSIAGWRFEGKDAIDGGSAWKASSRNAPAARKGRSNNPKKMGIAKRAAANLGPMQENGIFVRLQEVTADSLVEVTTAQGTFSFKVGDVKDGDPLDLLDGRAAVQRTAILGRQMSPDRSDDDFPALAVGKEGTACLVYLRFTPGIDRDERAKRWDAEPADLTFLAKPAGGDQLWLQVREGNTWGKDRIAVTEPGRDIYKSAVAVDGKGVIWIVWSERLAGNFDILSRSFANGKLGEVENLSKSPGNDVSPVASTDASGKVWVAWQGGKGENFAIWAKPQTDAGWGDTLAISNNTGNCWQPAIAASATGVAIAWDCYDKGDYDVWLWQSGGKPQPVANSPLYEARPALTYDKEGALWIAWEKSGPTWGKDWGAYDGQDGIGLYRDRQIGLAVLKDGQWMEPQGSVADALPGAQARPGRKGKARGADATTPPPPVLPELADGVNPDAYLQPAQRKGAPGEHAATTGWGTFNNLGRLACDAEGRVWLVARSRLNSFRGPVGSTWVSYAAYLDGAEWVGPILLPHSDNLIYNLPALAAGPQALFVAHSSDHRMDRFAEYNQARDPKGKGGNAALDASKDPFDNDVFFSRLQAQRPAQPAQLKPAAVQPLDNPPPSARTLAEREEVKTVRGYHTTVAGKELRILRGEFHRHTEISGDGAGDGPLEDMWRYGVDAASMDWLGNGDHDNGNGREYTWWLTQKTTDAFHLPGAFTPMFSYERSVSYPEGHRNCVFAQRGVRTLPRLPISDQRVFAPAPDTLMLYKYLHTFGGVCASHTSVGSMGTDWRNHDAVVEPMVEVYQGARQNYEYPGCPRCPTEDDAIGGWEPAGFLNNAFAKGYKFSFQSSSDHGSTHISYAMIYAEDTTREAILNAMKLRHTYGATDNIVADSRCTGADGTEHMMGDEFAVKGAPTITCKLIGTTPFAKVTMIKNNVEIPLEAPKSKEVSLTWTDPKPDKGNVSYYYIRGEQTNGELVWVSPMW
ncbi:MAG: hypothetical protein U0984_18195, partial [Prosthecobacter sp.]|nr:hypothetical protein [Prosthecobacter sp.]